MALTMLIAAGWAAGAQAQTAPPPGAAAPKSPPAAKAAKPPHGKVYHLLGFSLSGSRHIDADALVAKLPQHEGDVITPQEMQDDTKRISVALAALHVHGTMTTATAEREGKGHWIWVIWDIHKMDALSRAPLKPARHFVSQTFSGNSKLGADQLQAAIGLHAGDKMPDGSISDARTGIEQAYDKVFPGKPVQVKGKVEVKKDGSVLIDWLIAEPT